LSRKAEEAKPRQEAAVKGVRPSQPAPTGVVRPERKTAGEKTSSGGLIGFIKKLFGAKEEAPTEKRPTREGRNDRNDRNGRSRNNRNRNRNKTEGGERNTPEREGEDKAEKKEARPQQNRNQRPPREPRPPRENKPEGEETKLDQSKDASTQGVGDRPAQSADGEERPRSRNRRGRNRRDRTDRPENDAENNVAVDSAQSNIDNGGDTQAIATPANSAPTYVAPVAPAAPIIATPVATPVAAPVVAATPAVQAVAPEVVKAAPAPLPKVEFKALQPAELDSVLATAGMVWVNTDNSKLEEVRAQIAAEPTISHPPRQPKPAVKLSTEPMVLVETGGKEQIVEK
jgi:ribonuclease E